MALALFSFVRALLRPRTAFVAPAPAPAAAPITVAVARPRALRIVRSTQGRMVISGRMADVCAELDRLAALEAQGRFAPAR